MPTSSSSKRASAPLPGLEVTQAQQFHYDSLASQLVEKALAQYTQFNGFIDTDDWSLVRKRRQMSVYRAVHGRSGPHVMLMAGSGLIHGSLEDVMDGLYADNTLDLRAVKTHLHYKLKDAAVLQVSERRSEDAPFRFAGVKWVAAKAPWGSTKHRELLTYERSGTTSDDCGHEFAFHVVQSIDRPEWPPNAVKGVKRATTSTCYLYQRLPDNRVEVFLWGEFFDVGAISHRAAEYVVAGTWLSVVYSIDCAEAKRCSRLVSRASSGRAQPSRNACHICFKAPGVFEHPRHCAACVHSMCKGCSSTRATFELDARTGKPIELRFCKLCVNKAATPARPAAPAQAARVKSTSELSLSSDVSRPKSRSVGSPPKLQPHALAQHSKLFLKDVSHEQELMEETPTVSLAASEKAVMQRDEEPWTTSKLSNFDLGVIADSADNNSSNTVAAPEHERRSARYSRLSQPQQQSPAVRWQLRIESGLFA